jgi:hypothetical protein
MRRTVGRSSGLAWLVLLAVGCGGPPFVYVGGDASVDDGGSQDDGAVVTPPGDAGAADAAADVTVERDGSDRRDAGGEVRDAPGGGDEVGESDGGSLDSGGFADSAPEDASAGADSGGADGASCSVPCGTLCCPTNGKCCVSGSGASTTYKCATLNALCL